MIAASLILMMSIILVFIAIFLALIPYLTPPNIQFGVRLQGNLVSDERFRTLRRRYALSSIPVSVALIISFLFLAPLFPFAVLVAWPLIDIFILFLLYYTFHLKAAGIKGSSPDVEPKREGAVVAVPTGPGRVNRAWLAVPWLELALFLIVGALYYPSIPARFPVHFSASGSPNSYATKSILSVFAELLFVGIPVVTLLEAMAVVSLRVSPFQNARSPRKTAMQMVAFNKTMFYLLVFIATAVLMTLFLSSAITWEMVPRSDVFLPIVPVLVILPVTLVVSIRMGQAGSKLYPNVTESGSGITERDDDRFWKAGVIYYNKEDCSLLVPKRFGVGYTFNFAHPISWIALAAPFTVLAIVLAVVTKLI